MLNVVKEGVLLAATDMEFENQAVLNPATIQAGNEVHLFYRAVKKGNYSTIGYCRLAGPLTIVERLSTPLIPIENDYESHGLEDPRAVLLEGLYYITYTAFDGENALGAVAVSEDLKTFLKKGTIVGQITFDQLKKALSPLGKPVESYISYNHYNPILAKHDKEALILDKDVILFPKRIHGKMALMQRIKPGIQIVYFDRLEDLTHEFWHDYYLHFDQKILLEPKYAHENNYIGGGCTPIETPNGWLIIYHGVHDTAEGHVYSACAALLSLDDPQKELARLPYPLFFPEKDYELKGDVNRVVFPTGSALFEGTLYIYYGAADSKIAVASVNLEALLGELTASIKTEVH